MTAKLDHNFYAVRQAFDRGCAAARDYIVRRKAYPVTAEPKNPENVSDEQVHAAWTDGFADVMRKHGGWK